MTTLVRPGGASTSQHTAGAAANAIDAPYAPQLQRAAVPVSTTTSTIMRTGRHRSHVSASDHELRWLPAPGYYRSVDVDGEPIDLDDVLVVIAHPFGDVEVPLADWIATGPGPRRFTRPVQARSRSTGNRLPMSVIPLRYRNDDESRRATADERLDDPWPDAAD